MNEISVFIKDNPQRSLTPTAMGGCRENVPFMNEEEGFHQY